MTPSIITGAAERITAPHRPEGADVPQSLTPIGAGHQFPPVSGEPSSLPGGTSAPSPAPTFTAEGTGPRCVQCHRNVSMCLCDAPEPEPEWFKPGVNYDPDALVEFHERYLGDGTWRVEA